MRSKKFKVTVKGDEADESLRLSDLIDQLKALKTVLNEVDMAVSGKSVPGLYYRITSITMNSPATFEFEAVPRSSKSPNYGGRVVSRIKRDLDSVLAGKRPKDADLPLLDAYRGLVQPLRKQHVSQLVIHVESVEIDLPRSLDMKIEEILGPDQVEVGSIVGSLDVIDLHNQKNLFRVYPAVGPKSIQCHFKQGLVSKAVSGIGHFVRVSGQLHYKKTEKFPHFMQATTIEILPEKKAAAGLTAIRGMAPAAFGDLSSSEFVERSRGGDW
jgi:hypothetical protein